MKVNEIFKSIQGESTFVGLPCIFIRLSGCNLRCSYCDTQYAYEEGFEISIPEFLKKIQDYGCPLVEITGGEPLLQEETFELVKELINRGYKVLIETNGSIGLKRLDRRAIKVMDIKCPSSGMSDKMNWGNISFLSKMDQIKFVIGSKDDYEWAKDVIKKYSLIDKVEVLFSPSFGRLEPKTLAEWILQDNLNIRFQLQVHKYIWESNRRGV